MKRILLLLFLLTTTFGFTQVGVNTTTPDPSSMLDVSATNKGVLVPRISLTNVTLTMLDGTNTAATGLLIWNTNAATVGGNGIGFYFFNGVSWIPLTQAVTGNTLDQSYDQGGSGAGRIINVDSGSLEFIGNGSPNFTGIISNTNASNGLQINTSGNITTSSNSHAIEINNNVNTNSNFSNNYGVFNKMNVNGTASNGNSIGFRNWFLPAGNNVGSLYSFHSINQNAGAGPNYGYYSSIINNGNGFKYAFYSEISGAGTGNKFGLISSIESTSGGTHYGVYSSALKPGSFAGYFLGNVSIGTDTTNNYILPPSRGTNGQIIQTDGTGVLSWVTPTTGTDDQNLTTPTLTGTTLNLGIENGTGTSINLASLQDGTGTDDQNLTTPTLTGTTLNLGIENGTGTSINLSGLQDSDWYEVGGTNPANNITDNIYTGGDVSIGKNTAALAKLDIDANNKLNTLILDNNNTTSGSKNGINNSLTLTSSSSFSYGIRNSITGVGDWKYGIRNFINSNSSSLINELGIENFFTSIGNSNIWGYNNFYSPISSHVGNYFGFSNNVGSNHIGGVSGVYNSITSNTATYMHGVNNNLIGTGNAEVIGVNTTIGNSGTGNKYGEKITITSTLAGIHYGLYSDVTKTNSFAGYFLGNVSIGTDTSNNYILPSSQGTNGQIMQTNATGNVSWVNPPISESTTANNGLTEVGNNVQLGGSLVQNTSITQGNFNLDIDSSGTGNTSITNTGSANIALEITKTDNSVTDQYSIYNTKSSLNSSVDYALFNELTGTGTGIQYLTYNNMSTTGTGTKYGVYNNFEITSPAAKYGVYNNFLSNTGNYYGMLNNMTGSTSQAVFGVTNTLTGSGTGAKTGITNSFSGANGNVNPYNGLDNTFIDSGNGERSGVKNNMTGTGNGTHYGNYNELTGTGSGNKFGTYNLINSGAGGIHYGTYNSVNPANGWAGYFIGNSYFSYKVGIGEINPSGFLEVRAANSGAEPNLNLVNIGAAGARINFTDTNTTSNVWTLYGDTDNVVANSAFNIFHTTTGNIMRVTGDGLVGIMRAPTTNQLEINGTASKSAAGGFLANSDSRLKKNIVTISPTDALNKVLSLRGVTYEWNDDKTGMNRPEGMQLGFVAQEIQQVFPEKVSEDKQGYLQTAYGDYDPIIFQAIKALSDKIDKLEKENEELKKRIEDKK